MMPPGVEFTQADLVDLPMLNTDLENPQGSPGESSTSCGPQGYALLLLRLVELGGETWLQVQPSHRGWQLLSATSIAC